MRIVLPALSEHDVVLQEAPHVPLPDKANAHALGFAEDAKARQARRSDVLHLRLVHASQWHAHSLQR